MRPLTIAFSFVIALSFLLSCKKTQDTTVTPTTTDSFTVVVNNGYGSGKFKTGDTVHIFTSLYSDDQVFDKWSGDISILNAPEEWHTWFIMPNRNVTFTGSLKNITPFTLQYEQIMGKDRLKPVYSYFPPKQKAVVYLLHGTSGSAADLVHSYEWQLMIRDLIQNNFSVIITEAEESTAGVDINGDGKIRWNSLPWDTTTNVDFSNIKIITNTFINRGAMPASYPRYSIGMSNGGNFSTALATIYKFKSAVSYCAPSGNAITSSTTVPLQFCMARFDNNPNVGPTGNANALQDFQTLTFRGICGKYLVKERAPIYAQRFARDGSISVVQSTAVFNEIKAVGLLDTRNYFKGYSEDLQSAIRNNPSAFPTLNGLTIDQKLYVNQQISLSVSDHQMFSDFNKATIRFLNMQCQ